MNKRTERPLKTVSGIDYGKMNSEARDMSLHKDSDVTDALINYVMNASSPLWMLVRTDGNSTNPPTPIPPRDNAPVPPNYGPSPIKWAHDSHAFVWTDPVHAANELKINLSVDAEKSYLELDRSQVLATNLAAGLPVGTKWPEDYQPVECVDGIVFFKDHHTAEILAGCLDLLDPAVNWPEFFRSQAALIYARAGAMMIVAEAMKTPLPQKEKEPNGPDESEPFSGKGWVSGKAWDVITSQTTDTLKAVINESLLIGRPQEISEDVIRRIFAK